MKPFKKLTRLVDNLLNAKSVEDEGIAMAELRKFRDYSNYPANTRPDIEDAVEVLSNAVNVYHSKQEFVQWMNRTHRTLQQGMFSLFMARISYLGQLEDDRGYDGRNAWAVEESRDIISWLKFVDEMKCYHSIKDREEDSRISYLEVNKVELGEFVEFVRKFYNVHNIRFPDYK